MIASSCDSQPRPSQRRIVALDVIRGFALLGILLMNIECFAGPFDLGLTGINPAYHGLDWWFDAMVYWLIQGKFYTLFALLFGIGFVLMEQRCQQEPQVWLFRYLRRIGCLLFIGIAHAVFLWPGDILTTYAIVAFPLLVLRHLPKPLVLIAAIGCYFLTSFVTLLNACWGWLSPAFSLLAQRDQVKRGVAQAVQAQRLAYGHGHFWQATDQRLSDWQTALGNLPWNGPMILGLFLMGSWLMRCQMISQPAQWSTQWQLLRWRIGPLGLLLMLASIALVPSLDPSAMSVRQAIAIVLADFANLALGLGYFAWLMQWAPRLSWFAPAGRMALTNYLMQSVVCTFLFNHYGFGWYEHVSRSWQILIAVSLFSLQVVLSRWWLHRVQFGPCEWLWRAVTYWRWPAWRARCSSVTAIEPR